MGVVPGPAKIIICCKLHFISTSIKPIHNFLRIYRYASAWLGQCLIYDVRQVSHPNRAGAPSKLKLVLLSSLQGEADVSVPHLAFSFVCHVFENGKGSSRQYPPLLYMIIHRKKEWICFQAIISCGQNILKSISLTINILLYLQKVSVFNKETTKEQTPKKTKPWNRSINI